ncbi:prolyl oligopeptidase family serine peptidase [Chryseobacterium gotjawalense]|uniref:Prolyl oligopeptidase family serine peptidase n=1 Tax=Chryseobacterium gotjawalense TaxID=3042315 RepID=A0ABY8R9G4_9FLAO|nr:prolyl oligopeptidase family serine peptidase [Chryseobacterium sp. wdc7]WHF50593.1 prolyl oligopeptidase family serine peptidase [Chryseobacterium sp. wdc7]
MKTKVIKFAFLLILFCLFQCCISQKTQFGTKTEIRGSKDSAQSIGRISFIKSLDDSEFKEGQFSNGKESLKYRMLSPEKIKLEKKHPLIVVFHGSGAIGTDNKSQMGILSKMWLLPENRKRYPSFVLSPQFPVRSSNYHLDEKLGVPVSESNEYLDLLLKSIDSLSNSNNIDRSRIYVMGFSMGGATTSNAISKRPDLFAAAINISGISQFDNNEKLFRTPIWLVHGSLDTDNFPHSNLKFYEEMKEKGQVLFWEFKDKYHNNILSAKLVDAMPQWLFNQKK